MLYRFNRLVSLNEVGGDPSRFGASIAEFHAANAERRLRSPHALSATATHDTKRGEDVRARINVLSEIPIEWRARGRRLAAPQPQAARDGGRAADAGREHRVPASTRRWSAPGPSTPTRLRAYVLKATREAKSHTSLDQPQRPLRRDAGPLRRRDSRSRALVALPGRLHDVPGPGGPLRHAELAGPDPGEDHRARRARLLPGHRAVGSEPGRSRQPATGRLGPAATAAGRAATAAIAGADDRAALTQELVEDPGGRPREDVRDPRGAGVPRAAGARSSRPATTGPSRCTARGPSTSAPSRAWATAARP